MAGARRFGIDFIETTEEQALEFCAWWLAGSDDRLSDLAGWLDRTGGPLDAMDGTVVSLYAVRAWARELLGLDDGEHLPHGETPRPVPGAPMHLPAWHPWRPAEQGPFGQIALLRDAIDEYTMRVMRRLDPGLHWGILGGRRRRIPDAEFHATGWVSGSGAYFMSGSPGRTVLRGQDTAMTAAFGPDGYVFQTLGVAAPTAEQRGPSILIPFAQRTPIPPAQRTPPPELARDLVEREEASPTALMIPAGSRARDLSALHAFDPAALAEALASAGFRISAARPTSVDLLADAQLVHVRGWATAAVATRDDLPRGVLFETTAGGGDTWEGIRAAVEQGLSGAARFTSPTARWLQHAVRPASRRSPAALPLDDIGRGARLVFAIPRIDGPREPRPRDSAPLGGDELSSLRSTAGAPRALALTPLVPRQPLEGGGLLDVAVRGGLGRQVVVNLRGCSADRVAALIAAWAPLADLAGARLYLDKRRLDRSREPLPLAHLPLDDERRRFSWDPRGIFVLSEHARSTDPAHLPPLDPARIVPVLNAVGMTADGRRVTATDLLDRNRLSRAGDGGLTLLGIGVDRGAVRALHVVGGDDVSVDEQLLADLAAALPAAGAMLVLGTGVGSDAHDRRAHPWATHFDDLVAAERASGPGEYVIADGDLAVDDGVADADPYPALRPLPVEALASYFREIGAVPDHGNLTDDLMRVDGTELTFRDGVVTFLLTVRDGELRAVDIDTHGPTADEWSAAHAPLREVLASHGLRLRPSELAYNGLD